MMAKRPCAAKRRQIAVEKHWGRQCWLCADPKPISRKQFSVDHVIPQSKGGGHAIGNLRPAHKRCNWKRADGPVPDLLLTAAMALQGGE